jgi:hypothetical protein
MANPTQTKGRPQGENYTQVKSIRFDACDLERLRMLADRWRCSEAAAVRRAVSEAARLVSQEEMRQAAELALEYYTTDPDALELADFVGDDLDETG